MDPQYFTKQIELFDMTKGFLRKTYGESVKEYGKQHDLNWTDVLT